MSVEQIMLVTTRIVFSEGSEVEWLWFISFKCFIYRTRYVSENVLWAITKTSTFRFLNYKRDTLYFHGCWIITYTYYQSAKNTYDFHNFIKNLRRIIF